MLSVKISRSSLQVDRETGLTNTVLDVVLRASIKRPACLLHFRGCSTNVCIDRAAKVGKRWLHVESVPVPLEVGIECLGESQVKRLALWQQHMETRERFLRPMTGLVGPN
jgi:hypothetical protein